MIIETPKKLLVELRKNPTSYILFVLPNSDLGLRAEALLKGFVFYYVAHLIEPMTTQFRITHSPTLREYHYTEPINSYRGLDEIRLLLHK